MRTTPEEEKLIDLAVEKALGDKNILRWLIESAIEQELILISDDDEDSTFERGELYCAHSGNPLKQ
jgi:hypothetical protein